MAALFKRLIINNFNFSGIYVENINGLTVLSNYIGTTPDGTTAASNHFHGIHIDGASNVKVGDASIAGRNVILAISTTVLVPLTMPAILRF